MGCCGSSQPETKNNLYAVPSKQSFSATCETLEAAVKSNKFGVLGVHKIHETLKAKGIQDFKGQVAVYEVCNPQKAATVLKNDAEFCLALPCRIGVFTDAKDQVMVGQINPSGMFSLFGSLLSSKTEAQRKDLMQVASEVEEITTKIIDETVKVGGEKKEEPVAEKKQEEPKKEEEKKEEEKKE